MYLLKMKHLVLEVISKQSTNAESETDISQNVHFHLYHAYRHITWEQQVIWKKGKHLRYQQKVGKRMM